MRGVAFVAVLSVLAAGCHEDPPVDLSATSQIEYDAVMTDSTDAWAVAVTAANVGQTPVTFRISRCSVVPRVLAGPSGRVLFPDTVDGRVNFSCPASGPTVFDLEPGESRFLAETLLPPVDTLYERFAGNTYWIQATLQPGSQDGLEEEEFIDIGWVHLTRPEP